MTAAPFELAAASSCWNRLIYAAASSCWNRLIYAGAPALYVYQLTQSLERER